MVNWCSIDSWAFLTLSKRLKRSETFRDSFFPSSLFFQLLPSPKPRPLSEPSHIIMTADARETQLSIPKDGKAAIFTQKGGPVAVKTQAVPQEKDLKPGEALVRVIYSGGEYLEMLFRNRREDSIVFALFWLGFALTFWLSSSMPHWSARNARRLACSKQTPIGWWSRRVSDTIESERKVA